MTSTMDKAWEKKSRVVEEWWESRRGRGEENGRLEGGMGDRQFGN